MTRTYHTFRFKDSNFRICSDLTTVVCAEIVRQREILEAYVARHTEFKTSLVPLGLLDGAPEIAQAMVNAARLVGVGPMAGVAGAIAQRAAEAALKQGATEAIVENGGDIFAKSNQALLIGLHAGENSPVNKLAFRLEPEDMPRAVCSSSSRMGHSLSLGSCDLATVVARDAAIADAAATMACNLVREDHDMNKALEYITAIDGVDGALIANNGKVAILGTLPELVRNMDDSTQRKITRAPGSR